MSMSPEDLAKAIAQLSPEQQALFQQQLQAVQAQQAAQQAQSLHQAPLFARTEGGAVVQGPVLLANGHFVGRDLYQFLVQQSATEALAQEQALLVGEYLQDVQKQCQVVDLARIDKNSQQIQQRERLLLGDIYVPLDTDLVIDKASSLSEFLTQAKDHAEHKSRELRFVSVLEALKHHPHLTLLGPAGSGKSTVGARVVLALAEQGLGQEGALAALGEGWPLPKAVPIRMVLRHFARWLGQQEPSAQRVWEFVGEHLPKAQGSPPGTLLRALQSWARAHGAFFLFDGLDECGSPSQRARVARCLQAFQTQADPQWRSLSTARPYAVPEGPNPQRAVYALAPFNPGQMQAFVRCWYASLALKGIVTADRAEARAEALLPQLERADIQELAERPLLLTLMALLHTNDGNLPEDRVDLYDRAVDLLLERWNEQDKDDKNLRELLGGLPLSILRERLARLAFELHRKEQGRRSAQGRDAADIGEALLCKNMAELLGGDAERAKQVVEAIEERAGLLVGRGQRGASEGFGERSFAFPHRSFQEFLAAEYLRDLPEFDEQCCQLAEGDPGHWQDVLAMAARWAKGQRGVGAADALMGRTSPRDVQRPIRPADGHRALLAAQMLLELGPKRWATTEQSGPVLERARQWLVSCLPLHPNHGGMKAKDRVRAANALGQLGDPRFDPPRFFLPADANLGFVRIPANPHFLIGTHPDDAAKVKQATGHPPPDYELNHHPSPHGEFWVGKYPVTVAQFRAFCEAAQVQPSDPDALRGHHHHPVVSVSWEEAAAYARWLTQQLQTGPLQDHAVLGHWPGRWHIALPSELQWEAAARAGQARRVFPWAAGAPDEWDAELANAEMDIRATSSVGSYPPNAAGLHDMAGNVWEWTRSRWAPDGQDKGAWAYPYQEGELGREVTRAATEPMVVRGGAFFDHRHYARCGHRDYGVPPGDRDVNLGFRVVVVFSPV